MSAGTQTSAGLNRRQPPPLALDLQSLWVTYGDRTALRDVTAKVGWGLRVGVVGPNGSGKSTLLQTIVGLVTPRSGVIRVAGLPPKAARTQVAYVPQRERIRWDFPVSVLDVVVMGRYGRLGWLRRPGRADKEIALAALEQVNMTARAGTHISELSGGQQQRVFLARALAQEADLILLDEPLNGLDATTYAALLDVLERQQQAGKTVIMATHDLATAQTWCDLVIFLNTDLIAAGPPAECFTPEVLARTYGGAFVAVGGADKPQMVLHDDRHNH